jgi:hypothetical protein
VKLGLALIEMLCFVMFSWNVPCLLVFDRFGGFGSDFCSGNTTEMWKDRCEFVRLAGQRARQQFAGKLSEPVHRLCSGQHARPAAAPLPRHPCVGQLGLWC